MSKEASDSIKAAGGGLIHSDIKGKAQMHSPKHQIVLSVPGYLWQDPPAQTQCPQQLLSLALSSTPLTRSELHMAGPAPGTAAQQDVDISALCPLRLLHLLARIWTLNTATSYSKHWQALHPGKGLHCVHMLCVWCCKVAQRKLCVMWCDLHAQQNMPACVSSFHDSPDEAASQKDEQ